MLKLPVNDLRLKWVFRRDQPQRFYRVVRLLWVRGKVGDGTGYSAKLSIALDASIFRGVERDSKTDWRLTVLGVRLHYNRSYGGIMV